MPYKDWMQEADEEENMKKCLRQKVIGCDDCRHEAFRIECKQEINNEDDE